MISFTGKGDPVVLISFLFSFLFDISRFDVILCDSPFVIFYVLHFFSTMSWIFGWTLAFAFLVFYFSSSYKTKTVASNGKIRYR